MPLTELNFPVHLKHPRTGLPLCRNPKDPVTIFEASFFEDDATCLTCIKLLKE